MDLAREVNPSCLFWERYRQRCIKERGCLEVVSVFLSCAMTDKIDADAVIVFHTVVCRANGLPSKNFELMMKCQ